MRIEDLLEHLKELKDKSELEDRDIEENYEPRMKRFTIAAKVIAIVFYLSAVIYLTYKTLNAVDGTSYVYVMVLWSIMFATQWLEEKACQTYAHKLSAEKLKFANFKRGLNEQ